MKLIVGLGNPGNEYEGTRHNVGFSVLDDFKQEVADRLSEDAVWRLNKKFESQVAKLKVNGVDIFLLKPLTFMNLSGRAVAGVVNYYDIAIHDLLVVHDDLDLELGVINIKQGGGSAGHHGIDSINQALSDRNYTRLRVGVGKNMGKEVMGKKEGANYVLSKFNPQEEDLFLGVKKECVKALFCCLSQSLLDCQSLYNKKISNNLLMED